MWYQGKYYVRIYVMHRNTQSPAQVATEAEPGPTTSNTQGCVQEETEATTDNVAYATSNTQSHSRTLSCVQTEPDSHVATADNVAYTTQSHTQSHIQSHVQLKPEPQVETTINVAYATPSTQSHTQSCAQSHAQTELCAAGTSSSCGNYWQCGICYTQHLELCPRAVCNQKTSNITAYTI